MKDTSNIILIMTTLNALGIVLFTIMMFLFRKFYDKLDALIENQSEFNKSIAVLQTNDKNKSDYIKSVKQSLHDEIVINRANIDTCFKVMESNKKECFDYMRERIDNFNNELMKIKIDNEVNKAKGGKNE